MKSSNDIQIARFTTLGFIPHEKQHISIKKRNSFHIRSRLIPLRNRVYFTIHIGTIPLEK